MRPYNQSTNVEFIRSWKKIASILFGFRNGSATKEVLFAYNVLMQRCIDVNQKVYLLY